MSVVKFIIFPKIKLSINCDVQFEIYQDNKHLPYPQS